MRRLAGEREHLDGPLADRATLEGNLSDLARINRVFGGVDLSLRGMRGLFEAPAPATDGLPDVLGVLDVGTGAADIPLAMVRAPGPWRDLRVTAVDSRAEVIRAALAVRPELATDQRIEMGVADGRHLPYANGEFHVAHASLVLHHLDPDAAVPFLRELGRVARVGVVINDLGRSRLAWLGAWLLLHAMTRNAFTLHDGPLSVRRAYTPAEARELLAAAGLVPAFEARALFGHRWVVAAVRR